jgi:tetratricopeptide (TPR) repeat protein
LSELGEHIEALRRDPTSVEAARKVREIARAGGELSLYAREFTERGRRLAGQGLKDEAISSFIEAALVYEEDLEDLQAASELYRRVLEIDPGHRRAMFALGLILHDLDQFPDLVAIYRERLTRTSDDGERTTLLLYIAEILSEKLDRDDEAFEQVMKAAMLAPKNLRIITRLERLGERTNRLSEVAVVIGDLMLHQQDARVRAGLALRLAELHMGPLDDPQRALVYFRSALADDGGNPELLEQMEDVFRERERFADLAELIEEVARDRRVGPQRVRLERELARIYELELGDKKRALMALTRAARQLPDDRDLLDEVMRVGLSQGALDQVAATFEEVSKTTGNNLLRTYLLLKLGHLYAGVLDRPQDAIRAYDAILSEDPSHKEARRRLGNLCERVGDWSRLVALAEDELKLSSEIPAEQVEPLRKLARAKQRGLSDLAGAEEAYRKILDLSPDDQEATEAVARISESRARSEPKQAPKLSTDLTRVGRSVVETDPSSEAWTQFDGEEFGPEAETQWAPKPWPRPKARPRGGPSVILSEPDDPDDEEDDQLLAAMSGVAGGDLSSALGDESDVFASDVLEARPPPGSPPPAPSVEEGSNGPNTEVLDLADVIEEAPLLFGTGSESYVRNVDPTRETRVAELNALERELQEAERREDPPEIIAPILDKIVAGHEALGEWERAFFAEVKLARLDPREERLAKLIELGRRSRAFRATIATADELLPQVGLEARVRLEIALSELEAKDAEDAAAALRRIEALRARAPDHPLVLARWTDLLEDSGELLRLASVLEEEAERSPGERAKELLIRSAAIRGAKLSDPERAADLLIALLEASPDDAELEKEAARHLEAAGRWTELLRLFESKLYRLDGPGRAATRREIARVALEHLGDRDTAERMLRMALSEDVNDARALDALVALHAIEGDWNGVVEVLAGQLPLVPHPKDRASIRRRLAEVAERGLGNIDLALTHLDQALLEDPNDLEATATIERLRREVGDWAGVVEALELSARSTKDPLGAAERWIEVARIRRIRLANPRAAVASYKDALALAPNHAAALEELGETCEEIGDFAAAIEAFRRLSMISEGPVRARAHVRSGYIFSRSLDRPIEAAAEMERALDADPDCLDAISELSRHRERAGDFLEALELTEREASLVDDDRLRAQLWSRAAELARHRVGDPSRAAAAYRNALEADPDDLVNQASLGELYLEAGDAERAYTHLARSARGLKRSDGSRAAQLYTLAGRAAERSGMKEQAIAAYDAALELSPRSREALTRLAVVMAATKLWERAYELNAALLLHHEGALPDSERAQVYLRMAEAKLAVSDPEAAVRLARKAHAIDPSLEGALDLLADVLEREGDPAEAAELVRKRAALVADEVEKRAHLVRAAKLYAERANEIGKAVAILGELHTRSPHDVEVAELLARYREGAGEGRGAAQALAAAARTLEGRPRADLLVRAARSAMLGRDRTEARRLLMEAVQIAPTHREGFRDLALMLEYEGAFTELATIYERAALEFREDAFTGQDAIEGDRNRTAERCFQAAKDVYRYRLLRSHDALRVARAQRAIDGGRLEVKEELARLLEESAQHTDPSNAVTQREEALGLWAELVEEQPGLHFGLRRLYALRTERGDRTGAKIAAELLEVLGELEDVEARAFQEALLGDRAMVLPRRGASPIDLPPNREERTGLEGLFTQLGNAPLVACEDAMPEPILRRRDRVQLSALPPRLRGAIEETCALLGVPPPTIYARDDAPLPVGPGFSDKRPALVVSLALAGAEQAGALRFWTGRAVSLLRPRALSVSVLPLEVLRECLEGLLLEHEERADPALLFSDAKRARRRGKALERELNPSGRAAIVSRLSDWLLDPNRSTLDDEREAVLRTAERSGLVACGSLKVAVSELEVDGSRDRRWLVPLVRFAASRQYAALATQLMR